MALEVMPSQASAVPSERVFSSGKETDTLRRSNMLSKTMEILQVLKFNLKSERLDFWNHWITTERELWVLDVDPDILTDLLAKRKLEELSQLISLAFGAV